MKTGCCLLLLATPDDPLARRAVPLAGQSGYDYAEVSLARLLLLDARETAAYRKLLDEARLPAEVFNNAIPKGMALIGPHAVPVRLEDYIHRSLFLAFATLYPDAPMLFYFVIPIKAKWLAALWLFLEVYDIISLPSYLLPILVLPLLSAILNYLLYFWQDIGSLFGRVQIQRQHQRSAQTINFQKAQKELRERRGYLHKCAVCGVTDRDDPDMEFRYCSKCNGYYCYCTNHINNHTHVQ